MKILIASPVRANEQWKTEVFKLYLKSLDKLEKPCQTDRLFLLHESDHLIPLCACEAMLVQADSEFVTDEVTHRWDWKTTAIVAQMRTFLLNTALERGYDYIFLVDSDLLLHPKTLVKLVEAQKDIIAEVFWTKWNPDIPELPNGWHMDQYHFRSFEEMNSWKDPGIYKVGMTGACTLISRAVMEKASYNPIPNLSIWGEDRWFSIRAACAGFEIWLDTHYPCVHLYRQSEYENYMKGLVK